MLAYATWLDGGLLEAIRGYGLQEVIRGFMSNWSLLEAIGSRRLLEAVVGCWRLLEAVGGYWRLLDAIGGSVTAEAIGSMRLLAPGVVPGPYWRLCVSGGDQRLRMRCTH